jgi:outer membrane protein assembly factor BamB
MSFFPPKPLCWGHLVSTLLLAFVSGVAEDWPVFRGPDHNGISTESDWTDSWPTTGPKQLWSTEVGIGFSSVAVASGGAFSIGNKEGKDTVYCFEAETGKTLWSHSYASDLGSKFYEGGPGSTPTVDGSRVYALSKWGDLFCFEIDSGKIQWQRQLVHDEGFRLPDWGFSGSPFVFGDLLILNVGGAGMAVNKVTGENVWVSDDAEAGYSTPYPFTHKGRTILAFGTGDGYVAVNPTDGNIAWKIPWHTRYGVNAADPIVVGNEILVASGYGKGAALFEISGDEPKEVWMNRKLRSQQNATLLIDGYLYGFDGDAGSRANLKCVDWKTGEEIWASEILGYGALTAANGKLIALGAKGILMVAPASPKGFHPTAKATVLDGKCWTVPVLANGRIYCRNSTGKVVCLDVRKEPS